MEEFVINAAIGIVLTVVKNPAKKAALKRAMLKIYRAIQTAYAGDPDFA